MIIGDVEAFILIYGQKLQIKNKNVKDNSLRRSLRREKSFLIFLFFNFEMCINAK